MLHFAAPPGIPGLLGIPGVRGNPPANAESLDNRGMGFPPQQEVSVSWTDPVRSSPAIEPCAGY